MAERSKMSVYMFDGCPFCVRVTVAINRLGLSIEERNIYENEEFRNELIAARGRSTVPVLRIDFEDGTTTWMPESADIVDYLEQL